MEGTFIRQRRICKVHELYVAASSNKLNGHGVAVIFSFLHSANAGTAYGKSKN